MKTSRVLLTAALILGTHGFARDAAAQGIPDQLNTLQSTSNNILATVSRVDRILRNLDLRPVVLSTGNAFVPRVPATSDSHELVQAFDCNAVNVGEIPITIDIEAFDADGKPVLGFGGPVVLGPGKAIQRGFNALPGPLGFNPPPTYSTFWCSFTFTGTPNAVRAHMEVIGKLDTVPAILEAR